jgi:cyclohexadieny/prephenate dehydrogenase
MQYQVFFQSLLGLLPRIGFPDGEGISINGFVFEQLTILAPGLLGASLGKAARELSLARRIQVWARRAESREACQSSDWCDRAFSDAAESVEGSDLVVICTPVDSIVPMVKLIAPRLSEGTLVTDVGSTKSRICRLASHLVPEASVFIGSHPMAGSEKSGMQHASGDLFRNRACLVTPLEEAPPATVDLLVRFWKALGMEVTSLSPEKHDEIVAHISHLPHLLASLLALHLNRKPEAWQAFSGNGLRDTTRIAAGNSDIWRSIFEENKEELLRAIGEFEGELALMRSALHNGEWAHVRHLLELGKSFREGLD